MCELCASSGGGVSWSEQGRNVLPIAVGGATVCTASLSQDVETHTAVTYPGSKFGDSRPRDGAEIGILMSRPLVGISVAGFVRLRA